MKFPTQTVKASTLLPDLDKYEGPPIEFGRMEPTASDPTVQQQYGMTVGIPNAGQVNALGMINIRGERSVTCKGDFDKKPSAGPLPAGAPVVCEEFRKQPDALERAAELDATVRPESRPDGAADVLHSVLVQGPVRHQRHAVHRRRRCALRHRRSGARSHARRPAPRKGRDYLREGQHDRIQRPRGRSGRQEQTEQGAACPRSATSAARGRAIRLRRTTRREPRRSDPAPDRASRCRPTW